MSNIDYGGPKESLGVLSVFGTGLSILRNKPLSLIVSAIVMNVLLTALLFLISNVIYGVDITDLQAAAALANNVGYQVSTVVISLLGYGFMLAALTAMAYQAYNNAPIALGQIAGLGLRKMLLVAIMMIIVYLIIVLPTGIIVGTASVISPFSLFVVGPAALVLMLYLLALFSVVTQAIVIEGIGFGSLGRSLNLTKGYRWSIVGFYCLLFIVMICFTALMLLIFNVVSGAGFSNFNLATLALAGQSWSYQIVNAVLGAVLISYFTCLGVALFARLREIKEGLNDGVLSSVFD